MSIRFGGRRFPYQQLKTKPHHVAASGTGANCSGIVPLPGLGCTGTAKVPAKVAGAVPLSLGCVGTATVKVKSTGVVPLGPLACSGAAKSAAKCLGVVPLPGLGCAGHSGTTSLATGTIPLPGLHCSGGGKTLAKTNGPVLLPGLGCLGHSGTPIHATGVVPMPALGGLGTSGLPTAPKVTTHYQAQIDLALRLIREKGTTVTLRHYPEKGPASRDRVKDTVALDGHTDYTVTAVVMPMPSPRGMKTAATDLVLTRGRIVYIAGSTCPVYPHVDDRIIGLEGKIWVLEDDAKRLGPDGGPAILYTLRLKR